MHLPFVATLAMAAMAMLGASAVAQDAQNPPVGSDAATTSPTSPSPTPGSVRTDALVNRVLDAPVKLDLRETPLPEVLTSITDLTGVPFFVDDATYALLPYGRQTPISVTVSATPLRQTLGLITQRLGLEYVVRDERVELQPLAPLQRAGRRATVEEVALLDLLAGVPLELVDDRPTAAQVLEAVDLKLQALDAAAEAANRPKPGYVVENRLGDDLRGRRVFIARDATLSDAMESVHEQTGATWYPWGDTLVVVPKDAWIRRMLERPVTLSYDRVEVQQVLIDLEKAAGVPFRVEPGAIQQVPEEFRRVRLFLENATVREALDSIGGVTGLSYAAGEDGVYIGHGNATSGGVSNFLPGRPRGVELPVLLVDLGDGTSLLVYESDLPEAMRDRLDVRRKEAIDALRDPDEPAPAEEEVPTETAGQ